MINIHLCKNFNVTLLFVITHILFNHIYLAKAGNNLYLTEIKFCCDEACDGTEKWNTYRLVMSYNYPEGGDDY